MSLLYHYPHQIRGLLIEAKSIKRVYRPRMALYRSTRNERLDLYLIKL